MSFSHGSSSAMVTSLYGSFSLAASASKPPKLVKVALPGSPGATAWVLWTSRWVLSLSSVQLVHMCPEVWCRSGDLGGQEVLARMQPTEAGPVRNK